MKVKAEQRKHFIQTFNINEKQAGSTDRNSWKKLKYFSSIQQLNSKQNDTQSKFTYILQHTLNQE